VWSRIVRFFTQETDHLRLLSWVYFHGKAQDLNSYDLVFMQRDDVLKVEDGITPCVIVHDGKEHIGLAFIWTSELRMRGLIVLSHDGHAVEFAQKAYQERREYL
jgi:hypothetical protein